MILRMSPPGSGSSENSPVAAAESCLTFPDHVYVALRHDSDKILVII
jgi:hypothetical protein